MEFHDPSGDREHEQEGELGDAFRASPQADGDGNLRGRGGGQVNFVVAHARQLDEAQAGGAGDQRRRGLASDQEIQVLRLGRGFRVPVSSVISSKPGGSERRTTS